MVTDYVISTIQYIKDVLQVEVIGAVTIIALILLTVVSIIFFAFRNVRLWYWKINEQVKALEHIDKSLEEIKQNLPEIPRIETALSSIEDDSLEQAQALTEEGIKESRPKNAQTPKIVFDKMDKDERTIIKPGYNIGKTGKIYAEEALREQIQF
ncbi:MAG: hypothetical protein E7222_06920 [Clostridiales bacterium]|jgi:hypothetical protein|uniref:hypothetical protein n=1 Tax=Aminipila sp. TaxID=2060095 RepID=UPI001DC0CD94|nr:hypothetical protein [Aminipila sp.]MBE6034419.1 hypothetical protein [Clostridiales bacterium]